MISMYKKSANNADSSACQHSSTLFASPTSSPPATNLALISSTGAARPTMTTMGSGEETHPTAAAATTGAVASLPSPPPSVSVPPPVPSCSQTSTVTIADDDGGVAIKSPAQELTGTSGHGRELSPPDSNIAEEFKKPATDVDGDDYMDITDIPLAPTVAGEFKKEGNEGDSHTNQIVRGKKRVMVEVADAELEPEPKRARVVGLKNLGNTCYNNAVIQALSHTTLLRDYFIERETPEALHPMVSQLPVKTAGRPRTRREARLQEQLGTENSVDVNLCNEFSNLLRSMWGVGGILTTERRRRNPGRAATVVSPSAFADAVSALLPLFHERYEQQDAQEFLRCALEQMHLELSLENGDQASMDADNTIVNHVFGGVLWNKISCLSCCNYTIKADPFLDLSLVIPEGRDQVALEDCIDLFSLSEELESTASGSPSSPSSPASRTCLTCGSDQGFSRSTKLGELPRVLCIHLKRFRWRRNGKQKVDTPVRFPLQDLDMSRWLDDIGESTGEGLQRLYELYTVVIHQGNGANSGHYYAYVKDGEQWWSINDERAFRVQQDQVRKAKAYLLFYRPQETAISAPGSTVEDHSTATTVTATAHH